MKKLRISFILLAVMITFAGGMFFTSCEKENALESNENLNKTTNDESFQKKVENFDLSTIAVEDNILVFESMEIFNVGLSKLNEMEASEKMNWEKRNNFESMYSKHSDYEQNSTKLSDECKNEELYLSKNMKLTNDFEKVIDIENNEINIFDTYYAFAVNEDGKVKIANTIYTFKKNELIIEDKTNTEIIDMTDYYNIENNKKYQEIEVLKGLGTVTWNSETIEQTYKADGCRYKIKANAKSYSSNKMTADFWHYKKRWGSYRLSTLKYYELFEIYYKKSNGYSSSIYKVHGDNYYFSGYHFTSSSYGGSFTKIYFRGINFDERVNSSSNNFEISKT